MAEQNPVGTTLVWLRDDLRLSDNPALHHALERGGDVVVAFVHDEITPGIRSLGAASKWWLHQSLSRLGDDLESRGSRLILRRGAAAEVIAALIDESGADAVVWNRRYAKGARDADAALKKALGESGVEVHSFQANLLFEPWTIQTGQGTPFKVFTPFYRACLAQPEPRHPFPSPETIPSSVAAGLESDDLVSWGFEPTRPDWAGGLRERWQPGESGAHERLESFISDDLGDYGDRDFPADDTTSHLSPYLRFGEISPFQVWHRLRGRVPSPAEGQVAGFLREVIWREFNNVVLYSTPDLATQNYRPEFDEFEWDDPDPAVLEAWQQGRTGVPLVDAGMRELWKTGVMHNRVRMVVASFLIKNLLIDWRLGEQWFWDTLVDADDANNPANWQWVAGSGADAAPFFRVFNPELQASKFDKHGEYVRQWVPEFGTDAYPAPIVDLKETRRRALDRYDTMRRKAGLA